MANRRYLKDKKIVIYKKVSYENENGFQVEGYMPIHEQPSLWAYFKQLSSQLIYLNDSTQSKEECLFRINWLDYVRNTNPSDLAIGYRGLVYNIARVDPYEDYKRDLVLYAKNNHDKLDNVIPYDKDILQESE
jgi:hypothetical protein